MRQALHIFLKDTRLLRYPIVLALGWIVLFVAASSQPLPEMLFRNLNPWQRGWRLVVPEIATYVFSAVWWFLISQAFHAEAFPGDRQFWLTRPYSRTSLLVAKVMFVLAYVCLPLMAAQTAILMLRGFPLMPALPGLVWMQVLVLSAIVLPVAAVATVTTTLVQSLLVGLVFLPLLFVYQNMLPAWGAVEWIRSTVELAIVVPVCGLVIFIQVRRRSTRMSRIVALSGILLVVATVPLVSWPRAFAAQSGLSEALDRPLEARLVRPEPKNAEIVDRGIRYTEMTFQLVGVPASTPISCHGAEVVINDENGELWNAERAALRAMGGPLAPTWSTAGAGCTVNLPTPGTLLNSVADRKVAIDAALFVTLFGREETVWLPVGQRAVVVPAAGLCAATRDPLIRGVRADPPDRPATRVACQLPFREPQGITIASAGVPSDEGVMARRYSFSPFPASLRIPPFDYFQALLPGADVVTLRTRFPVAHVRVPVHATDISLQHFEIRLGR